MAEYTKIETARAIICDMCKCLYPDEDCPGKCDWMKCLKEDAADVAPVVHGRLVREVREVTEAVSVKGWACSVCGGFVKNQPVDRWRYCPFCGAPFDGGDLDGQKV